MNFITRNRGFVSFYFIALALSVIQMGLVNEYNQNQNNHTIEVNQSI